MSVFIISAVISFSICSIVGYLFLIEFLKQIKTANRYKHLEFQRKESGK